MIKKYDEFLVEKIISMINESEVVYSQKFRNLLRDINSPISTVLREIETKDLNVTNNYFDISDNKDQISFISDRKAKEILGSDPKYAIYQGGPCLTHNLEQNGKIFTLLGYEPKGSEPYRPSEDERCEIVSKAVSPSSGRVFVKLKFGDKECVCSEERLSYDDLSKEVWSKNRQKIRTGRGIKALLSSFDKKFTDSEVEDFVNKYKSAYDRLNDIYRNFELVSGNDISYWYSYKNYSRGADRGTLGNSCMSGVPPLFFDIYVYNTDVCGLLILKDESDPTKIKGRALVWKLKEPQITFVDRIYTHEDSDVQLFRDYAKFQKWHYKANNDSSAYPETIDPDGSRVRHNEFTVFIEKGEYKKYPYVDTVKYYNSNTGELTTEGEDNSDYIDLEDTDGGYVGYDGDECETCGGTGRVECSECDGSTEVDCEDCHGTGKYECEKCDGKGCDDCDGTGKIKCDNCDGEGQIECDNCDGTGNVDCPECNW